MNETASDVSFVVTTDAHAEEFNRVLGVLCREKKFLAALEPPPLEGTRKFIQMMLESKAPTFMAVSDGKVVGWCDIQRGKGVHEHVGLLGMGLLPAFRNKGIGSRLMARALQAAWDCGMTRVELVVREENANAVAMYKKLGFQIEGLKRQSHLIEGKYENSYLMSLLRSEAKGV
jgi:ribosomal protein S18 acetylase RimI-like enzyme